MNTAKPNTTAARLAHSAVMRGEMLAAASGVRNGSEVQAEMRDAYARRARRKAK